MISPDFVQDISIHALRKESDILPEEILRQVEISIHALRKESDTDNGDGTWDIQLFQSTLSVRRATSTN